MSASPSRRLGAHGRGPVRIFRDLILAGRSEVGTRPLQLVAEACMLARRPPVAALRTAAGRPAEPCAPLSTCPGGSCAPCVRRRRHLAGCL